MSITLKNWPHRRKLDQEEGGRWSGPILLLNLLLLFQPRTICHIKISQKERTCSFGKNLYQYYAVVTFEHCMSVSIICYPTAPAQLAMPKDSEIAPATSCCQYCYSLNVSFVPKQPFSRFLWHALYTYCVLALAFIRYWHVITIKWLFQNGQCSYPKYWGCKLWAEKWNGNNLE